MDQSVTYSQLVMRDPHFAVDIEAGQEGQRVSTFSTLLHDRTETDYP